MSIVDYSIPYPGPTINTTYFPNTKCVLLLVVYYHRLDPDSAWDVDFYDGGVYAATIRTTDMLRSVRARRTVWSLNFVDNGNGTVTDNNNRPDVAAGRPGDMTWFTRFHIARTLTASGSGQTDWRLPNIKELESITDDTRYYPAMIPTLLSECHMRPVYWSSTTYANYPSDAWIVGFYNGNV